MLKAGAKSALLACAIALTCAGGALAGPGPDVAITNPVDGSTISDSGNVGALEFDALADYSRADCKYDDQPYRPCADIFVEFPNFANGDHAYSVRTRDGDGDAHVATTTFTVDDDTAPALSADVVGGSPAGDRPAFELTTDESLVTVYVSIDGAGVDRFRAWGAMIDWEPRKLANGNHTIQFTVVDPAGNSASTQIAFELDDAVAPSVTIESPADGSMLATDALTAQFSSDDPSASFSCSLDGSPPQSCLPGDSVVFGNLGDGAHQFAVSAIDEAGNASSASADFTVGGATSALTVLAPADGATITARPNLALDYGGTIRPGSLRCRVGGGAWSHCATGEPIPGLDANGIWQLEVRAIDDSTGERIQGVSGFTVDDDSAPTITVPEVPPVFADAEAFDPGVALSDLDADGNETGAAGGTCSLDEGPAGDCIDLLFARETLLTPGDHTLGLTAYDWVGNAAAGSSAFSITDTTAPSLAILSPAPDAELTEGAVTLDFTTDLDPLTAPAADCKLDAGDPVACDATREDGVWSWTARGLSPGAHTLSVTVRDRAGNENTASVAIEVTDGVSPAIAFEWPAPGFVFSDRVVTYFRLSESVKRLRCAVDLGAYSEDADACRLLPDEPRKGIFRPRSLTSGLHTLNVEATDFAGNVGITGITINIADSTAPSLSFTAASEINDSPVEIGFQSDDPNASFECALDGGAGAPCTSPAAIGAVTAGMHTLSVTATDPSGNDTTASVDFADTTPPSLTVSGVWDGMATGTSVTTEVSAAGHLTLDCAVDDAAFASCSDGHFAPAFTTSGAHTLRYRATDLAGNSATREFVVQATVPVTPPVDPGTPPPPPAAKPAASAKIAAPKLKVTKKTVSVTVSAAVSLPAGVTPAAACSGKARLAVVVGKKTVKRAAPALKLVKGKCTIKATLKVAAKSIAGKKFKLTLSCPGNALIAPFSASKTGKSGRAR